MTQETCGNRPLPEEEPKLASSKIVQPTGSDREEGELSSDDDLDESTESSKPPPCKRPHLAPKESYNTAPKTTSSGMHLILPTLIC